MAKKNYKKLLPKAGSTLAVAVAMSVALSTQVNATGLDDDGQQNNGNPLENGQESNVNLNLDGMAPAEANAAIDEANKEIVEDNKEVVEDNEKIEQENKENAEQNEANTNGELPNPDLDLPDAPEVPNTDDMNVGDHNQAVGDYNDKVDDYNDKVDDYNDKVDDYNDAADAYDEQAQENYEQEKEIYDQEKPEYDANAAARDQYEKELAEYEANKDKLESDYQKALEEYEKAKQENADAVAARDQYEKELAEYEANKDKLEADYQKALAEYEAAKKANQNQNAEKEIYEEVTDYNTQIEEDNEIIDDMLAELDNLDVGVEESIDDVSELNQNVVIDDNLLTILTPAEGEEDKFAYLRDLYADLKDKATAEDTDVGTLVKAELTKEKYNALASKKQTLESEAQKLAEHTGKNAELGSDEYAAYLEAVEDYNALVEEFNEAAKSFNDAAALYNAAVEHYNQNKPEVPGDTSTGEGTETGNASNVNWGNINMGTADHVDVKYQSAASKVVEKDENGNETLTDKVTQYTVTGVYANETIANEQKEKTEADREYSVTFDNDGTGTQDSCMLPMEKDDGNDEFGSNRSSGAVYEQVQADSLDTSKTYYIESKDHWGNTTYVEIKYKNNKWQKQSGYSSTAVNVNEVAVYEGKSIAINRDSGTISFHVTLEDDAGTDYGINVNLNANSVYAEGSYYKAKYDAWNNEEGKLHRYYTGTDEQGNKIGLPVVWLKTDENGVTTEVEEGTEGAEKYYDISGQSVYLISSLTCIGMGEDYRTGNLTIDGLDLVLNMQTMIEIHQSVNAEKLGVFEYELEKTAQAEDPGDPGAFTDPEPEAPKAPDFVPEPGNAPTAPTAPAPTHRLNHATGKLNKLNEKIEIVIPPVNPNPNPNPQPNPVVPLNGDGLVTIDDGAVPLADVPKTGDASVVFGAMSAFSGFGLALMQLFGRKKKEEN